MSRISPSRSRVSLCFSRSRHRPNGTDRPAVEKQIVANEKAIVDAVLKNDPKTFHSYILADSFAMASQGVIAVADFDPVMKQQATDCKVTKFEFPRIEILLDERHHRSSHV